MCGICGVITDHITDDEKEIFKTLLKINVFRGKDSTGLFSVTQKKNKKTRQGSGWYKIATDAWDLTNNREKELDDAISGNLSALVGHCRAATIGKVTVDNAHPFDFPNVIGVHNGTVRDTFEGKNSFGTDSEAIYNLLNNTKKIEEAINEFNYYQAAFALVWYDKRTGLLHLLRNKERPLHGVYVHGKRTVLLSSDEHHLRFVLAQHNLLKTASEIKQIPEEKLISFDLAAKDPVAKYWEEPLNLEKKSAAYSGVYRPIGGTTTKINTASKKSVNESFDKTTYAYDDGVYYTSSDTEDEDRTYHKDMEEWSDIISPFNEVICEYDVKLLNFWFDKDLTEDVTELYQTKHTDGKKLIFRYNKRWGRVGIIQQLGKSTKNKEEYDPVRVKFVQGSSVNALGDLEEANVILHILKDGKESPVKLYPYKDENENRLELKDDKEPDMPDFLKRSVTRQTTEKKEHFTEAEVHRPIGWHGTWLTEEELQDRLASGCEFCLDNATSVDDIIWTSETTYVDKHCAEIPEVKEYLIEEVGYDTDWR